MTDEMSDRVEHVSAMTGLPPIRTDLAEAKRDLDDYGLTRFAGAVSEPRLSRLRERLAAQAAGEGARGLRWSEGPNQRVWTLINKGEVFRDWATNPARANGRQASLDRANIYRLVG